VKYFFLAHTACDFLHFSTYTLSFSPDRLDACSEKL
jgi:hypothetical protein